MDERGFDAARSNIRVMPNTTERKCGDCRLCCKVMQVESIPEKFDKPQGQWCEHAFNGGCRIYLNRPKSCITFRCAWLQGAFGERERPDESHVVVALEMSVGQELKDANHRVIASDLPVWCVYEAWPGVSRQPRAREIVKEVEQMLVTTRDEPDKWAGPYPVCVIPSAGGMRRIKLPGMDRYVPCLREGEEMPHD